MNREFELNSCLFVKYQYEIKCRLIIDIAMSNTNNSRLCYSK